MRRRGRARQPGHHGKRSLGPRDRGRLDNTSALIRLAVSVVSGRCKVTTSHRGQSSPSESIRSVPSGAISGSGVEDQDPLDERLQAGDDLLSDQTGTNYADGRGRERAVGPIDCQVDQSCLAIWSASTSCR